MHASSTFQLDKMQLKIGPRARILPGQLVRKRGYDQSNQHLMPNEGRDSGLDASFPVRSRGFTSTQTHDTMCYVSVADVVMRRRFRRTRKIDGKSDYVASASDEQPENFSRAALSSPSFSSTREKLISGIINSRSQM